MKYGDCGKHATKLDKKEEEKREKFLARRLFGTFLRAHAVLSAVSREMGVQRRPITSRKMIGNGFIIGSFCTRSVVNGEMFRVSPGLLARRLRPTPPRCGRAITCQ
jgi:hypothetical protein